MLAQLRNYSDCRWTTLSHDISTFEQLKCLKIEDTIWIHANLEKLLNRSIQSAVNKMEQTWMEHKKMIQPQSLHLRSRADAELNLDLPNSWPYLRQVLERPLYSDNFLVSSKSTSSHACRLDSEGFIGQKIFGPYFKISLFVCLLIFP
jgi:hypothetical protein